MQCTKQNLSFNSKKYVCLSLSVPEIEDYTMVNNRTIIIIDVSGSMGSSADNPLLPLSERSNLTVLDIVKHTAKTVVNVQNDNDELAIITYSNDATIKLNMTKMTVDGKSKAIDAINSMMPTGMTNIYDGIKKAYDIIKQFSTSNINTTIMLLSDGVPNIEPPRGTYQQFKKDVEDSMVQCPRINTFGFGYGVDVNVLQKLSTVSQGSFAFIPDSNFVGTVIVNSLANTMCTTYNNTSLTVVLPTLNYNVLGNYEVLKSSWGFKINIGDIKIGQPRHFIIELLDDVNINNEDILISSCNINTNETSNFNFNDIACNESLILYNIFRLKGIELMSQLSNNSESIMNVKNFIKIMEANNHNDDIDCLIQDFKGQVLEAISTDDAYNKWGGKYLPSLICAHQLEECNNFKDIGVQNYGGKLFKKLQTTCEDIFTSMPPPVPTPTYQGYSYASTHVAVATPVNMTTFYNRCGSCFHGDSFVLMADNVLQQLSTIKKGDMTSRGRVECVVKTKCLDNKMQYCRTDKGLLITKYHPMILNGNYVFPVDHYPAEIVESDYMYSLVLEKSILKRPETVVINDTECVTLGHGIYNDTVASHDFFGTENVINVLKNTKGWSNGIVVLKAGYELFTRDDKTNLVNNINLDQEII